MPDQAPSAALPAIAPTSPLPVVNGGAVRGRPYQVREVLWGHEKRFVVQDTATHTTVVIRTTRQIADSDLMRLNWAARDRPDPSTTLQPAQNERSAEQVPDNALGRQCARCRKLFASDPTLYQAAIQDWWLCESCHDKLM